MDKEDTISRSGSSETDDANEYRRFETGSRQELIRSETDDGQGPGHSKNSGRQEPRLFESVHAGFPSPAEDIPGTALDINRLVVKNPASTFFARVSGDSMEGDGIRDGDILVVDKSEEPHDGAVAVCYVNGEFTVKRLRIRKGCITLLPSNPKYKAITIKEGDDLTVWGIVRYVIKKV